MTEIKEHAFFSSIPMDPDEEVRERENGCLFFLLLLLLLLLLFFTIMLLQPRVCVSVCMCVCVCDRCCTQLRKQSETDTARP